MNKKDRVIILDDDNLVHHDLLRILTISFGKLITNPIIVTSLDDFNRAFTGKHPWEIVIVDFQHQALAEMRQSEIDEFVRGVKAHRFSDFLFIGITGSSYQKSCLEKNGIRVLCKTYQKEQFDALLGKQDSETKIETIMKIVCDYDGLDCEEVISKSRKDEVLWARYAIMYFSRLFTKASLKCIGEHLGGKDHTSVIHGCQEVKDKLDTDDQYCDKMFRLGSKIGKWFQMELPEFTSVSLAS